MMDDIRSDCEKLLVHIKKCKRAMVFDSYSDVGVIGYFVKLPFQKIHTKNFERIETYIYKIREYITLNNIELELEIFQELKNSSVLYDNSQIYSLIYKQYEHRTKYLDDLERKIKLLIDILDNIKDK